MTLPLRSEINVHDSLDERVACDNFAGKTLEEAAHMCAENPSRFCEDLMHMGPVAFRYYVMAATRQVRATKDSELVSNFVGVLELWLGFQRSEVVPIAAHLRETCESIVANPDEFGIRKTPGQIQADAEAFSETFAEASKTYTLREVLGPAFDPLRFVNLQARYLDVCDSLRQIEART